MQGKTHRVGGVLSALLGFSILSSNNMLIPNVEPILQLTVMYPFAIYGSVMPDLDHNWNSAPVKDPVSWCINKILHLSNKDDKHGINLLNAKHRSWQTHSELFLLICIVLGIFTGLPSLSGVNGIIFKLIFLGFIFGLASHLILDSLTTEGIWFIVASIILRKKVVFRLVPKSKKFSTGGSWENTIRYIMWIIVILLMIYVIYTLSPYVIKFNFK